MLNGNDIINTKTIENKTGLIFAVMNNQDKIVKFLLKRGADPSICGNDIYFSDFLFILLKLDSTSYCF